MCQERVHGSDLRLSSTLTGAVLRLKDFASAAMALLRSLRQFSDSVVSGRAIDSVQNVF